ncbi:hypothetical protein D3C72_1989390 [compost metagenome]
MAAALAAALPLAACARASTWARLISAWPSLMAALVPLLNTRLPSKRNRSTWVSAAMTTRSASAMSLAVSAFCEPTEPWVSTLIW